eukprot:TRINITY_DN19872_c0_g1_i3.p1 TRINITY_DN19872_c0_g1~~TRINITY_DN19872_c0_g1_i3.p1  ORF type:complete len:641 (-),score=142.59 TRINITY_DN19872_c0_g1_i3:209-2131(-)
MHSPGKAPAMSREDFDFGEIIGHGAYSYVRECVRRGEKKERLAAKVIEKRLVNQEKKLDQVMAESRVLKRLDHPNIVKWAGSFRDRREGSSGDENSGFFYIIMEHLDGGELASVLRSFGALESECVRYITAELLSALDYMHEMGLVHRDLKPENVIFNSGNHVKLVDFGCVKATNEDPTDHAMEDLFSEVMEWNGDTEPELDWAQRARDLASQLQQESRGLARYEMTILGDIMERISAAKLECTKRLDQLQSSLAELEIPEHMKQAVVGIDVCTLEKDQLTEVHSVLQQRGCDKAVTACENVVNAVHKRKRCVQLARDTAWRQRREYDRASQTGTQEYQAPELVTKDARASRASDLWALGCVTAQLLTGELRSPFSGATDYLTQKNIMACEYSWQGPDLVDQPGIQFVDALLKLDPIDRLGSQNVHGHDLWRHDMLSEMDRESLTTTAPPRLRSNQLMTQITGPRREAAPDSVLPGEDGRVIAQAGVAKPEVSNCPKRKNPVGERERAQWRQFLLPGEDIVLSGVLRKRAHIFSNPERRFLLTQILRNDRVLSRLLYIDEKRMAQRGEVPWSEHTRAELKDDHQFEIQTPRQVFKLEDRDGQAQLWVDQINSMVKSCPQHQRGSNHSIDEDDQPGCGFCG